MATVNPRPPGSSAAAALRLGTPVLATTEWGDRAGATVVFLHGMLGSAEYWHSVASLLPDRRTIAVDLLGFGASPRPAIANYDYHDHVDAIVATLDASGISEPVVLVGHSMGALIALRLAAGHPERVSRLVLVGMPVFESAAAARQVIGRTRARRSLLYGPVSWLFCHVWCQALRPISRRVAPLYVRSVPAGVARATVEHSWRSYSRSLANVVEDQTVEADLRDVACRTLIVYGDLDQDAPVPASRPLPANVRVLTMEGDHQLPLHRPGEFARLIRADSLEEDD